MSNLINSDAALGHGEYSLLETLLWEPKSGWFLLDQHLQRLSTSAEFFGYVYSENSIVSRLENYAEQIEQQQSIRVRLLVDQSGGLDISHVLSPGVGQQMALAIANEPVSSEDIFLQHKTTNRAVYDKFLDARGSADDVILWNEREELTECCLGNLCLRFAQEWLTPKLDSGLLAGTYRKHLIDQGKIVERTLAIDMLDDADEIAFINSVRKWCPAVLIG